MYFPLTLQMSSNTALLDAVGGYDSVSDVDTVLKRKSARRTVSLVSGYESEHQQLKEHTPKQKTYQSGNDKSASSPESCSPGIDYNNSMGEFQLDEAIRKLGALFDQTDKREQQAEHSFVHGGMISFFFSPSQTLVAALQRVLSNSEEGSESNL